MALFVSSTLALEAFASAVNVKKASETPAFDMFNFILPGIFRVVLNFRIEVSQVGRVFVRKRMQKENRK